MTAMKVHIIGPAGSGKTTLSRWIVHHHGGKAHDLDWVVFTTDRERSALEVSKDLASIIAQTAWVTEGAYRASWLEPVLESADLIIWLDFNWRICAWRIFKRHVSAELARTNKHPGWRRMVRFMNYTRRIDARSREETAELVAPYAAKVLRVRNRTAVQRLMSDDLA